MKRFYSLAALVVSLSLLLMLGACSGGGGGGSSSNNTPAATTTTVSGKVTLSSTVSAKPALYAAQMNNKLQLSKSGASSKPFGAGQSINTVLTAAGVNQSAALSNAVVELYDADKPEWLYPVSVDTAGPNTINPTAGDYKLAVLMNAASNPNADGSAPYVDGDPIPSGNYTIIAYKYDASYGKLFVAVQAVVKNFAGNVIGNNLVAQDSDAVPTVVSMFGLPKNSDGTYGSSTTLVPVNSAIQITFSMAMARLSVMDAATVKDTSGAAVPGKWKVSADLLAVTFYPTNTLIPNNVYTLTIGGGNASKTAKNVFGKKLSATVTGTFKTSPEDKTPPTAIRNRPTNLEKTDMPITTPVRIASDEALDINAFDIISTPSIGDKPSIKYIGKSTAAADANYPFVYEIVPSIPLSLNTTYTITVSGGKDLAGLPMDVLQFSFTTEASSSGVVTVGQTTTEIKAQLAVKDVLGKWVNAMNSRNLTLLTSYMSGDFYWLNDTSKGMSSDDLNRDGRMSLNEFTLMMQKWFGQLEHCGASVTGDIVGNITLASASTANINFTLTVTPTNTTDSECGKDMGPSSALSASLENINSAWMMTRGADYQITTFPPSLKIVDLVEPTNGAQFPEPSANAPLQPDFKWTVPTLGTTDPAITTYIVVLIDNRSPYQQTGWVALVDGSGVSAGQTMSVKFNSMPGDYGTTLIPSFSNNGNNPFGFNSMINEIVSGGDYSWAVLGFNTKTLTDFKVMNFDPSQYLSASSASNNFTTGGTFKELSVVVKDSAGTAYTYSDWDNGYNVGSSGTVYLTVSSPVSSTTGTGCYYVDGYTSSSGNLIFTNGVSAPITLNLSNGRNWVQVSDTCGSNTMSGGPSTSQSAGLTKQFGVFTSGGALPLIAITSVTGKKCDGVTTVNLGTKDSWNQYPSVAELCSIDITGTVSSSLNINSLYLNVNNNDGYGQYQKNITASPGSSYTFTGIPVYKGRNWVNIGAWDNMTQKSHSNNFGVDTVVGSIYVAPITVSVLNATPTSSTMWETYYDVASAATATITITMPNATICTTGGNCANYSQSVDPNRQWIAGGSIPATPYTIGLTLYTGWNYINIGDGSGSWYNVYIYTNGGSKYAAPNAITQIDTTTVTGYTTYSTSACSVVITGQTTTGGLMNVNLSNYNSTSGASVWESQQVTPTGASSPYSYSFTQPVYNGANEISVSDASWNWAGLHVDVTGSCTPIVFDVTALKAGTTTLSPDPMGDYNAGDTTQYITIQGTAKSGKSVTVSVSGMYWSTLSATAASNNTFTIPNVPVYAGMNYLSISDGNNWVYRDVYTNGAGATWTSPINNVAVAVSTGGTYATKTSGGGASDSWSSWNTDADTITITGAASVSGQGTWSQSGAYYGSGYMSVASGAIQSFTVTLGYGSNNIYLYDANWNSYNLNIYTTGGTNAPVQNVTITNPTQGAPASGAMTVSGNITQFSPTIVYGYVYDNSTYVSSYYSSDPTDVTYYGYLPLTYNSTTGNFSFSATAVNGNSTMIEVYGTDSAGNQHGTYIYVNSTSMDTPYFWKAGANKASRDTAAARAHKIEFMKKSMKKSMRK